MNAYIIPIVFGSFVAVCLSHTYCYYRYRLALHEEGILQFTDEGAEYRLGVLEGWKALSKKRRNFITFWGAFGVIILLVLSLLILLFGMYHYYIALGGVEPIVLSQ